MKQFYNVLQKCTLFSEIDIKDYEDILKQLDAKILNYKKNQIIKETGTEFDTVGIVLEGKIHANKMDLNGQRRIIAILGPGETYGEALAFAGIKRCPATILAATAAVMILIPVKSILNINNKNQLFIRALIKSMANKYLAIYIKNDILSKNTTREKVLAFFAYKKRELKKDEIQLNFNREEMADYLGLNRSALSRTLSLMEKEGLISFSKNKFTIKVNYTESIFNN